MNVSDLAAKGATPLAYTLSLGLSADIDEAWLTGFAAGLARDQERFAIGLLGGDTITVPNGPVISMTAFGRVARGRMVHRFGAKPGDALYVSGAIGAGAAGLAVLKGEPGPWDGLSTADRAALVSHLPRAGAAGRALRRACRVRIRGDGRFGRACRRL